MNSEKIALFGTPSETTEFLAIEALKRGHYVTVVVPDTRELSLRYLNLKVLKGDARKKGDVSRFAKGNDVIICAYETTQSNPFEHLEITHSVIEGTKEADVHHLVFAAHHFGQPTERTKASYNEFKAVLKVQQEALKLFQHEKEIQWVYAHSVEPEPDEKSGNYLTRREILVSTPEGENRISAQEYASAIFNEAEKSEVELYRYF